MNATRYTKPLTHCLLGAALLLLGTTLACATPPTDGSNDSSWLPNANYYPGLLSNPIDLYNGAPHGDRDMATAAAMQSNGKLLVAGYSWNHFVGHGLFPIIFTDDEYACVVERFNANGSVDGSFGVSGRAVFNLGVQGTAHDCYVNSMVVLSGDKILLSGYKYDGSDDYAMQISLNADGSTDSTFGDYGFAFGPKGSAITQTVALNGGVDGVFSVGWQFVPSNFFPAREFYYTVGGLDAPQDSGDVYVGGVLYGGGGANAAVIEFNTASHTKELYMVGSFSNADYASGLAHHSCAVVALRSVNNVPFAADTAFDSDGIKTFDDPVTPTDDTDTLCKAAAPVPIAGQFTLWPAGVAVGGQRVYATGANQRSFYLLVSLNRLGQITFHDDLSGALFSGQALPGAYDSINALSTDSDQNLLIVGSDGNSAGFTAVYGVSDMGIKRLDSSFAPDSRWDRGQYAYYMSLDGRITPSTYTYPTGQTEYATAIALDPSHARAYIVGVRSFDIANNAEDYDWLIGAVKDVKDRIFGDTFETAP